MILTCLERAKSEGQGQGIGIGLRGDIKIRKSIIEGILQVIKMSNAKEVMIIAVMTVEKRKISIVTIEVIADLRVKA